MTEPRLQYVNAPIICTFCDTTNQPDAKFCAGCGAALEKKTGTLDTSNYPASTPDAASETVQLSAASVPSSSAGGSSERPKRCEMIIGFLIPRRCENPALGVCPMCQRSFCDEHLEITEHGMICVACKQGLDRPVALSETASTYDDSDVVIFAAASSWDDDDDDLFSDLS